MANIAFGGRPWSKEEIQLLEEMASKGHSSREISEALKDRTRNAVLGEAHRRGIKVGKKKEPAKGRKRDRRKEASNVIGLKTKPTPERRPPAVKPEPVEAIVVHLPKPVVHVQPDPRPKREGILFINRERFQCAYIFGNAQGAETRCCGAPVVSGSWCEEHRAKVFVPMRKGVGAPPKFKFKF